MKPMITFETDLQDKIMRERERENMSSNDMVVSHFKSIDIKCFGDWMNDI